MVNSITVDRFRHLARGSVAPPSSPIILQACTQWVRKFNMKRLKTGCLFVTVILFPLEISFIVLDKLWWLWCTFEEAVVGLFCITGRNGIILAALFCGLACLFFFCKLSCVYWRSTIFQHYTSLHRFFSFALGVLLHRRYIDLKATCMRNARQGR